ncbi:MAG: sulfate adenylyltransferase subunit CysN [Alphaproteobacteria bacterium]
MQLAATAIPPDLDAFLARERQRSSLRFITCGSVDDGKSTLIGRLLYESKLLFDDQIATLVTDSKRAGTQNGGLDFSLLVDGLAAEREQGITIDVAYRFFATSQRKFIVADTPGHEQYTRNMATGASLCDLAIILVDARKGLLTQTRRHSVIVSMLGVRHVVLAINKIDLVGYSEAVFNRIRTDFQNFARDLGFDEICCIPVSALRGDNVVARSAHTAWYEGPSLLEHLEAVEVENDSLRRPFRMAVQWVNRPSADFRGFSGLITSGTVSTGDRVRAVLSGLEARVARITTHDGDLDRAGAGRSVTLLLDREIDISRGELICAAEAPATRASDFRARLLWTGDGALVPGKSYLLRIGTRSVTATVRRPDYVLDINTLARHPADTLRMNEMGFCQIVLDQPAAFDSYARSRETGSFILIDRESNDTLAMGFVESISDGEPDQDLGRPAPEIGQTGDRRRVGHRVGRILSWGVISTIVTFGIAFAVTGDRSVAMTVAVAELAAQSALFWAHRQAWQRVDRRPDRI